MKFGDFISMQIDYMRLSSIKKAIEKSDKKIKNLEDELYMEKTINKLMTKKALKLCKKHRSKYRYYEKESGEQ